MTAILAKISINMHYIKKRDVFNYTHSVGFANTVSIRIDLTSRNGEKTVFRKSISQ